MAFVRRAVADDLGSVAGRLAKIGTDMKELKPRLDLRPSGAAADYAAAAGAVRAALNALRRLEIHEQGGVTASKGTGTVTDQTAREALLALAAHFDGLADHMHTESFISCYRAAARTAREWATAAMARAKEAEPAVSEGGEAEAGRIDPGTTENLGALLASTRAGLGWSLRDAARATSIPNAHISQLETGKIANPGITLLVKLARAYDLPLRRLVNAAGQGADWALVTEATEAEIRADEREKIAKLADEHEAQYLIDRGDHADFRAFADLIREQP